MGIAERVQEEHSLRVNAWNRVRAIDADGMLTASQIENLGLYGGQAGIWRHKKRTSGTGAEHGLAVSLRHNGTSYADDLSETGLLYHYPATDRPPSHDIGEINAAKASCAFGLPVFVLIGSKNQARRQVRLGYIEEWHDATSLFSVKFENEPFEPSDTTEFDDFQGTGHLPVRILRSVQSRPNQARFALAVFKRYGKRCAVCDYAVPGGVVAAHLIPKKATGVDDALNGLPLCANHHASFDQGHWRIDPNGFRVVASPKWSVTRLRLDQLNLDHLPAMPHPSAVEFLWSKGFKPI